MGSETHLTLNTGALMPRIGLGTWKAEPGAVGDAVTYALTDAGYRHIDCAAIYGNEKEIGLAFEKVFSSGKLRRDDVFVTSKLWNSMHAKDAVRSACEATLADLRLDYLDLYLMHWGIATPPDDAPGARDLDEDGIQILEKISARETWEAMQELVKAGLVKAIGVANFTAPMLIDLLSYASIPPAMNQVELHPYFQQTRLVEFCRHYDISVTAYSPLGRPGALNDDSARIIDDPVIRAIATAHGKTPSQVILRWGIQRDTTVIPKSTRPERIRENAGVFDFSLSEADMTAIAGLERNLRLVDPYEWGKIPYFS